MGLMAGLGMASGVDATPGNATPVASAAAVQSVGTAVAPAGPVSAKAIAGPRDGTLRSFLGQRSGILPMEAKSGWRDAAGPVRLAKRVRADAYPPAVARADGDAAAAPGTGQEGASGLSDGGRDPAESAEAVPAKESDSVSEKSEGTDEGSGDLAARIQANKAMALARRAASVAQAQGKYPALRDLLVDASWREALAGEFERPYLANLQAFVEQEEAAHPGAIFPPAACVFAALNSCPLDRVRVVILGQDPYHQPGQAMGLSFSVPRGVRVPSSLQNMFKELATDVPGFQPPRHGDLTGWAQQGVLLLNAVLTVRCSFANSHQKKGWELFTDAVIRALSQRRKGVVFLLWGASAQAKARIVDAGMHHVLKAPHPSGLSAHRGFFGCRHFSQANRLLEDGGKGAISWQL